MPGNEKNKGSILQRAILFINELKANDCQNIEKYSLERIFLEQTLHQSTAACDKLKAESVRHALERDLWQKAAQRAGVRPTDEEFAGLDKAVALALAPSPSPAAHAEQHADANDEQTAK